MYRKLGQQSGNVLKLRQKQNYLVSMYFSANIFPAKYISQQRAKEMDLRMILGHNSDGKVSIKKKKKEVKNYL